MVALGSRLGFALVAIWLTIAAAPLAAAHAAPDPPEPMTRLLHDFNDDWGGDAGARGGHDLMALDLAERYNATWKTNVLVLRLSMTGGFAGDDPPSRLRDVVSLKAGGDAVEFEFATTDNGRFEGTFDAIAGPFPLLKADGKPDGSRFAVEGIVRWDEHGLKEGDRLSSFFVQGYADDGKADHMVGGFTVGGEKNDAIPPTEDASPASYRRSDYALRGPTMYVTTRLTPTEVDLDAVDNKTVTWTLTNPLGRAQSVSLASSAPEGVSVAFHDGEHYGDGALTTRLAADESKVVHAYVLASGRPVSGTLRLALLTDLGGYHVDEVEVNGIVEERGSGNGIPPSPVGLALLCIAAAALLRARRY